MEPIQKVLINNIQQLISSSEAVEGIDHQGIKGSAREEYLEIFLSKYLPHQWGTGRGKIVDVNGRVSGECDLIIYDRNALPRTALGVTNYIFPIDSVKYVIEVKSTINATEIKTTINKFNKIKKMNVRSEVKPKRLLFAFKSDLKSKHELERLREIDNEFQTDPAIRILLCIGKGYYYFQEREYKMIEAKEVVRVSLYYQISAMPNNFEVGMLLFGILGSLNPNLPSFASYFRDYDGKGKFDEVYSKIIDRYPYEEVEEKRVNEDVLISAKMIHIHGEPLSLKYKVNLLWNHLKHLLRERKLSYRFKDLLLSQVLFPGIEILIQNKSVNNIEIKAIYIAASGGMAWFIPLENINSNKVINSNENKELTSKFLFTPVNPSLKVKATIGFVSLSEDNFVGYHSHEFNSHMNDKTFIKVVFRTMNHNIFYSNEIPIENEFIGKYDYLTILLNNMGPIRTEFNDDKNNVGYFLHNTSTGFKMKKKKK